MRVADLLNDSLMITPSISITYATLEVNGEQVEAGVLAMIMDAWPVPMSIPLSMEMMDQLISELVEARKQVDWSMPITAIEDNEVVH